MSPHSCFKLPFSPHPQDEGTDDKGSCLKLTFNFSADNFWPHQDKSIRVPCLLDNELKELSYIISILRNVSSVKPQHIFVCGLLRREGSFGLSEEDQRAVGATK